MFQAEISPSVFYLLYSILFFSIVFYYVTVYILCVIVYSEDQPLVFQSSN